MSSNSATEASSAQDPIPTNHTREMTSPPRKRRRGWIALWILLAIAILFQFNPLHPVAWWQEQKDQLRQGMEAADRDKAENAARARHKAQQAQLQNAQPITPALNAPTPH